MVYTSANFCPHKKFQKLTKLDTATKQNLNKGHYLGEFFGFKYSIIKLEKINLKKFNALNRP